MTPADRSADPRPDLRLDPSRFTPTQRRTAETALELFADHGVSGTSLQMIADELGVTKAAVYHQFHTKEEIVLAVAEVELAGLQAALSEAESEPDRDEARRMLLRHVVDVAVERRRWVGALQGDPAMIRLLGEHEPFAALLTRVYALLIGEPDDPDAWVRAAIVGAAIGGAVATPMLDSVDDDLLRSELLAVARRAVGLGP